MDTSMPSVYDGREPYVFTSYAHSDSETVLPIIDKLESRGYRIWYDAGIEAGSEWPEYIAEKLEACSCFVAFISNASVKSHNCKHEISYAIELNKSMLIVYMEDVDLTSGMKMQLNPIQALFRSKFKNDKQFMESLARAKVLEPCKAKTPSETEPPTEGPVQNKDGGKKRPELPVEALIAISSILIIAILCVIIEFPKPHASPSESSPNSTGTDSEETVEIAGNGGVLMHDSYTPKSDNAIEEMGKQRVFGSNYTRSQVHSLTFQSTPPETSEPGLDVSAEGDGTVLAWFTEGTAGLVDVVVAANGMVEAPTDSSRLFMGYTALRDIDLSGLDTSGVKNMMCMFEGCSLLNKIELGTFKTDNVENMGFMFEYCSNLQSLDLSSFNTGKVKTMRAIFHACSSLKTITFGKNFDTKSVEDMSYMFHSCAALDSLDLSSFNTENVEDMTCMFIYCPALTSLNLTSFNTPNLTQMASMFGECSELKSIEFSKGFNTSQVTTLENVFSGCGKLKHLDLTGWNVSNVTNVGNLFKNTSGLIVDYPKGDASWEALIQGPLANTAEFVAK